MKHWYSFFGIIALVLWAGGVGAEQHRTLKDQWAQVKQRKMVVPTKSMQQPYSLNQNVLKQLRLGNSLKPGQLPPEEPFSEDGLQKLASRFQKSLQQAREVASWQIHWNDRQGVPQYVTNIEDDSPLREVGVSERTCGIPPENNGYSGVGEGYCGAFKPGR